MKYTQPLTQSKVLLALAVTLMSTAGISTAALAGDAKVYVGSMCDPAQGTDVSNVNRNGGIFNNSNNPVLVRCPIVRDITGSSDNSFNGPFATIQLQRFGTPPSATTQCQMRTYQANGNVFSERISSVTTSAGDFTINIAAVPQSPGGAYEISCSLPPLTGLERYIVTE